MLLGRALLLSKQVFVESNINYWLGLWRERLCIDGTGPSTPTPQESANAPPRRKRTKRPRKTVWFTYRQPVRFIPMRQGKPYDTCPIANVYDDFAPLKPAGKIPPFSLEDAPLPSRRPRRVFFAAGAVNSSDPAAPQSSYTCLVVPVPPATPTATAKRRLAMDGQSGPRVRSNTTVVRPGILREPVAETDAEDDVPLTSVKERLQSPLPSPAPTLAAEAVKGSAAAAAAAAPSPTTATASAAPTSPPRSPPTRYASVLATTKMHVSKLFAELARPSAPPRRTPSVSP
ncbi:hypothetical protein RI367_004465 [Sorochytrium milnesiophthora]